MSDGGAVRRPTIRDVAARAGVSKSLVALVYTAPARVSAERTRRVMEAAAELGFRPNLVARSLAGTVDVIAILVGDLHDPLAADIVTAAHLALAGGGVPSLISVVAGADHDPDALTLRFVRDVRPAGVLIVGWVPDLDVMLAQAPPTLRVALASGTPSDAASASVRGDDRAGIGLAVGHLAGRGHRLIAFVGGRGGRGAEERERAYVAEMRRIGLAAGIRIQPSDHAVKEGGDAVAELLSGPAGARPTAIVTADDRTAVGVMAGAAERGVQLAVTGYDNSEIARLPQVSLTSVDSRTDEIGRLAAAAVRDPAVSGTVLVAPELVVRDSSPPPPRG